LQALEDQNRALDEEVGELRELRDREGVSADVREMEHELKVRDSSSSPAVWVWLCWWEAWVELLAQQS
jgi:hypothetical protein